MKDFAHTSFHPDLVTTMEIALDSAVAKLPHPVRSAHVIAIAESILRSASEGERDVSALEMLALLELRSRWRMSRWVDRRCRSSWTNGRTGACANSEAAVSRTSHSDHVCKFTRKSSP
jgi:hypothetical protein